MWEDPIVSETRREREKLSAQFGFDVKAIFADLRNRQRALGARLVSRSKAAEELHALVPSPLPGSAREHSLAADADD
jgi:hypothetical protein